MQSVIVKENEEMLPQRAFNTYHKLVNLRVSLLERLLEHLHAVSQLVAVTKNMSKPTSLWDWGSA
jgi:hypothetical protein